VLYPYELNKAALKTTEKLYPATGQPKIMTKINLLQLILMVRTDLSVNIVPATAGSLRLVTLVMLLQQLVSHLAPALVLVLSIGLGAVSYGVFM
jgi:hypothetical protein